MLAAAGRNKRYYFACVLERNGNNMKLENLKRDFPEMPEEIRNMIEQEVQKQLRTTKKNYTVKKALIAAMAAAMLLGVTGFAGVIYQMRNEPVGEYAVHTTLVENKTESAEMQQITDISKIKMRLSYLPSGMVELEEGKYSYQDTLNQGGVSIVFYRMDIGDAQFDMLTKNVIHQEAVKVGGYDGVYLELQGAEDGSISFNQRIYVAYTDLHYIMEMYAASDVTKEDALKIAEGVELQPVSDNETQGIIHASNWSEFAKSQDETEIILESNLAVPKSAMKTYTIGEIFPAHPVAAEDGLENLEIRVSDVQIYDNLSPLNISQMDNDEQEALKKETDASGKLLPTKINYIRSGDGVNSLSEVVDSREVPQKLVYATVEYSNTGDTELSNVLFFGSLVKIEEDGNQVKLFDGKKTTTTTGWDRREIVGAAHMVEMWYYDVHGGERGNNYINQLKPGETITVHMAWLVPEEELEVLYLSFDTMGSPYEFDEHSLQTGYVDIRQ